MFLQSHLSHHMGNSLGINLKSHILHLTFSIPSISFLSSLILKLFRRPGPFISWEATHRKAVLASEDPHHSQTALSKPAHFYRTPKTPKKLSWAMPLQRIGTISSPNRKCHALSPIRSFLRTSPVVTSFHDGYRADIYLPR